MSILMDMIFANEFAATFIDNHNFSLRQLPASGSARQNFVVETENKNYILTYNPNLQENEAFFYFSDLFRELELNTPKILKISEDRRLYLQEYLGQHTLSEIISERNLCQSTESLVKQTLEKLQILQTKTLGKVDYSKTFEYEAYNDLAITHDLYYFKNFLIDVLELEYHKSSLLKEFKHMAEIIEKLSPKGLMIRDFQSRNIMVDHEENVHFIDYQSAMNGPLMYDVVSFLYQAKANFPETFKEDMVHYYLQLWDNEHIREQLLSSVPFLKLIRFMQVLGAYGFRGLIQRKAHFLESLELGIRNLVHFMKDWSFASQFPELNNLVAKLNTPETQQKINHLIHN